MNKSSIESVGQLAGKANPLNPRKISAEQLKMLADSLRKFGDLSGLILNVRTNHLVGGHQRVKVLGEAPVEITKRYATPSPNGTVAEGFVIFEGERYTYREVSWDEPTENAAMIAANKHGGDWDFPALSSLLLELDSGQFDVSLTGFSSKELERMVRGITTNDNDEIQPLSKEEIDLLPALKEEEVTELLRRESAASGKRQLAGVLSAHLPRRLCETLLTLTGMPADRGAAALSKTDRTNLVRYIKALSIPVTGTLGFKKAEVTAGGIALDEVDSRTMQSKREPELFLAGEVLDLDGPIGGYNFQAAWSTGWLAGGTV